jgi:hypothetical protein
MKKGPVVTKWAEPREWRRVLLRYANEDPSLNSWTRFVPFIVVGIGISAILAWHWLNSDREGLLSVLTTVVAYALVYGVFFMFYSLRRRFVSTKVWIRENGIEMGETLGEREWCGFSEIIGFFFDTDTIEGKAYRSLYWLPEGAQYPDSAVIPREVDETKIRALLTSKGLEELELDE